MKKQILFLIVGIFLLNFCFAYDVTYTAKNATIESGNYLNTTNQNINGFSTEGYVCLNSGCSLLGTKLDSLNKTTNTNSVTLTFPPTLLSSHGYAIYFYKEGYIGYEQKDITYWGSGNDVGTIYLSKQRTGIADIFATINTTSRPNENVALDVYVDSPINNRNLTNVSLKENAKVKVTLEILNGSNVTYSTYQNVTLNYSEQDKVVSFNYNFPSAGNYTVKVYSDVIDSKILNSQRDWVNASVNVVESPVIDNTVPTLNLPSTINVNTINNSGLNVSFVVNATDIVDGNLNVSCNKSSGSLFPLGLTSVFCNTSDYSGNIANGSFLVNVTFVNSSNNNSLYSLNMTNPQNTTYNSTTIPLNYSINGTATSCWYVLNSITYPLDSCQNLSFIQNISNGTNIFTLFVSNSSVNLSSSTNFTVNFSSINDTLAPTILINSPENKPYTINLTRINVSLNEPGFCNYSVGNSANKTLSLFGNYFIANETLSNGNYVLDVFCSDYFGNKNQSRVNFIVNVSAGNDDDEEDEDSDDDNSNEDKIFLKGYVASSDGNFTGETLVLNDTENSNSWFGLFLIFLLLCAVVLFFIVLVLFLRERKEKK